MMEDLREMAAPNNNTQDPDVCMKLIESRPHLWSGPDYGVEKSPYPATST